MAMASLAGAGDGASSCAEMAAAKTANATKTVAMLTLAMKGDGGGCDDGSERKSDGSERKSDGGGGAEVLKVGGVCGGIYRERGERERGIVRRECRWEACHERGQLASKRFDSFGYARMVHTRLGDYPIHQ